MSSIYTTSTNGGYTSTSTSTTSRTSTTHTTTSTKPPQPHTQTFPLAHPPPPKHTLRLTPHFTLQIQQLTPASRRPIPILEVYQPTRFGKTLGDAPRKLTARDMYIVQSDGYAHLPEEDQSQGAVVGVIYMPAKEENRKMAFPGGGVWFPVGEGWEVSVTARGGYRFVFKGRADGVSRVVEWEKRVAKGRSSSSASEGSEMKRDGLKVGGWDRAQREYLASSLRSGNEVEEDAALFTSILTMGVYVAAQEGWLS
ncbi:hypothetical protein ANOM_005531 [Aspergillus nomiae NRRL 13137]|uniref:Uncharacterized protein n=1 Tax=Aspergillus nomiae NRRL (strain ATCC 15546 / NRRL 13137 / CBS 260.88 / M93) TaxID=1509407 RepID=A0A0L1J3E0_ASPN3|nr:uncharacterized protein ANOM_005531 [Aspergillus nomiae NRRL 13137]KNG86185.1 hypothetical protein ANOM_005531 [Aspergillus nomiae NRRL 13137]